MTSISINCKSFFKTFLMQQKQQQQLCDLNHIKILEEQKTLIDILIFFLI